LSTAEVSDLVTSLNKEKTAAGRRKIIADKLAEVAEAALTAQVVEKTIEDGTTLKAYRNTRRGPSVKGTFNSAVTSFLKVTPTALADAIAPEDAASVRARLGEVISHAIAIQAALDAPPAPAEAPPAEESAA
jgi:hypothetical protein